MFAPRFYSAPQQPNFSSLFRLLDDFEQHSNQSGGRHSRLVQTFTPKFDLRETKAGYELHGELPGFEKENVHIEFADENTVIVRGKVARNYTTAAPLAVAEKSEEMSSALTDAGEEGVLVDHESESETASVKSHQATVEDEETKDTATESQPTPATEVAKSAEQPKPAPPMAKYWLSERSVGEFSRTFTFPARVETEAVNASLTNGILSITVPKAKKPEIRRIAVV